MSGSATYLINALRLTGWLVFLAVVFAPLERLLMLRETPLRSKKAVLVDIGYYFVNSLLPATVLSAIMTCLVMVSHAVLPAGYFAGMAALPLLVSLPASLLIAELGFYWGHRWAHEVPLLWRFHSVHHEPEHLAWLANTRGHPIDMIFVRLCGLTPLYILGISSIADAKGSAIASIAIIIGTAWGFFIHTNTRARLSILDGIVATPFFHHWHHTRLKPIDRNYAAMLPVMDRVFGTYHMPDQWPAEYGIHTGQD